jgi:hypothetical protein
VKIWVEQGEDCHLLSNAGSSILAVLVMAAGDAGGGGAMGEAPKLKGDGGGRFFREYAAGFKNTPPSTPP